MNIEKLIENVYEHICRPSPKTVLNYPSLQCAFDQFEKWSELAGEVTTCFWSYQFPMVIPSSYWARSHLASENYRLDVKRTPNSNGCFVYCDYLNSDEGKLLTKENYLLLCSGLNQKKFDKSVEILVEHVLEYYEEKFDQLSKRLHAEDPTNQMGIDDFILLGNFVWLQQEIWMLKKLKEEFNVRVNESMLETLKRIQDSNKLFITFSNLVVVAELT